MARGRPGVRRPGDGVRALPRHADQHRAGPSRGPFPAIAGSIYDPEEFALAAAAAAGTLLLATGAARRWIGTPSSMASTSIGIRNAAQTTVAPTGTIATVAGLRGLWLRTGLCPGLYPPCQRQWQGPAIDLRQPALRTSLDCGRAGRGRRALRIIEHVMEHGTCQGLAEVPEAVAACLRGLAGYQRRRTRAHAGGAAGLRR